MKIFGIILCGGAMGIATSYMGYSPIDWQFYAWSAPVWIGCGLISAGSAQ